MATFTSYFRTVTEFSLNEFKYDSTQPHNGIKGMINALSAVDNGSISGYAMAAIDSDSGVFANGTVTVAAVANADTITINGQVLTCSQSHATGTVTFASAVANDTVTINGSLFTAVTGTPTAAQFKVGVSDTADAASLAAQVNASTDPLLVGLITATSAAAVVTFRAVSSGTAANSYTLATNNNTRLAKSGTTLANGAAESNNHFDFTGTDTQNAADIVRAIGASTTALISGAVSASNVGAVVTVTSMFHGTAGNQTTLASSNNTRLAVSGARLTGGVNLTYQTFHVGL